MEHFIKDYRIYIKFDKFTVKVGGCIGTTKRNLKQSRDSVTKIWYTLLILVLMR